MPQPLKNLLRGKTTFSYIGQLPTQHPQLCALAMAVIAEWSALDGAVLGLLTTMFPGRGEPINTIPHLGLTVQKPRCFTLWPRP
jgi:hypothetical protein